MSSSFGTSAKSTLLPRRPRAAELDGKNYFFVTEEEFMSRVGRGQMIEIVRFGAHHYGLEASHVERGFESEKDVVLTCEPFGMRQIAEWSAKNGVRHIPVYVNNPSEIIAERFPKRFGFDIAEAMIHRDPQAAADVLKGYARRLSEML